MHNRIVCDCDARWLYQWLISNRLSSPECAGPPSLDGNELTKLFLSEFCSEYKERWREKEEAGIIILFIVTP